MQAHPLKGPLIISSDIQANNFSQTQFFSSQKTKELSLPGIQRQLCFWVQLFCIFVPLVLIMVEIESNAENIGVTNDIEKSFKELNLTVHKQKVHICYCIITGVFLSEEFSLYIVI